MFRNALIALLVISALGGVAWGLFGAEATRLHHIRVVGIQRASEAQIRHLAGLEMDAPLVQVDLGSAVAGVEQHPWVAHAEARRVFPDTVVIQVEERQVRALLMLDRLYLVDHDGVAFRIASSPDLDHPYITGIPYELSQQHPELARRIVNDALSWLDAAEGRGGLGEKDISEIHFDSKSGYALALRNGGEVRLGFRDHSILNRLDALVAQGVDLSHPHRVDLGLDKLAVVTPL